MSGLLLAGRKIRGGQSNSPFRLSYAFSKDLKNSGDSWARSLYVEISAEIFVTRLQKIPISMNPKTTQPTSKGEIQK
jgi:hypothetical protein